MTKQIRFLTMLTMLMLTSVLVNAQGVTSSAVNGKIVDAAGTSLPGANVVALNVPTGAQYATNTRGDGSFNIPNIPAGGPYKITVSFVGYTDFVEENIFLSLGENRDFAIQLKEESVALAEVIVVGVADNTFNSSRTGAKTNVSNDQIQKLPSINRSFVDYARLTPQAIVTGSGISFSGINNRYNNFQVDGTVSNDVFGLSSSGTNGGQAGTQPISLDAIQELQVVIAPFDVRQGGFVGGGINAVTKSGTNTIKGSAYMFYNNQDFVGMTPITNEDLEKKQLIDPAFKRKKLDAYTDRQIGFTIGGPIIKNKLFVFVSGEIAKKEIPSTFNMGEGSNISAGTLRQIVDRLKVIAPNYTPGDTGKFTNSTPNKKFLVRLDWNVNAKNRLTIRHSYVDATSDILGRSADYFRFNDNGYTFKSMTNSSVVELNTRINNQFSNELRIGYTMVRDSRETSGEPFPYIQIQGIDGNTNRSIDIGTERFSMANELDQNILSISDNFTWYKGDHIFTIGTHNEFFSFRNLFLRDNYGAYIYSSLNNFLIGALPKEYAYSYSTVAGSPRWAPEFNANQLSFYLQDEWNVSKRLKLTAGIRMDMPMFPDKPSVNTAFNDNAFFKAFNVATDQMPKTSPLWSPRLGFNFDVTGNRSTQLRGGLGIFTGRLPFVWLSNQFSNSGVEYSRYSFTTPAQFPVGFAFNPNINSQPVGTVAASSEINVVDPDFKFPQVFRVNLAVDQKLPFGVKGTIEGVYSKTLNNILYKDLQRGESANRLAGIDDRIKYEQKYPAGPLPYTNVIYLTNTSEGYTYSLSGSLQKDFAFGLSMYAAYTYGKSLTNNDGTSSQAYSNWRFIEQTKGANNPELSYSDFDVRNRIVASVSYKKEYAKMFATSVALFYNGQTGSNFSYVMNGDINGDGQTSNDLVFIPTDQQIDTWVANNQFQNLVVGPTTYLPIDQANALKAFIAQEPYLKDRRGEFAERNAARVPFESLIDFRLTQDFYLTVAGQKNTLQLTLDIFNLGNLLNSDWGRISYVSNNYRLMDYRQLQPVTNLPVYRFNPTTPNKVWQTSDFTSRWRAQIGIRYIFN